MSSKFVRTQNSLLGDSDQRTYSSGHTAQCLGVSFKMAILTMLHFPKPYQWVASFSPIATSPSIYSISASVLCSLFLAVPPKTFQNFNGVLNIIFFNSTSEKVQENYAVSAVGHIILWIFLYQLTSNLSGMHIINFFIGLVSCFILSNMNSTANQHVLAGKNQD